MNNYEFCCQWVLHHAKRSKGKIRVLDYGCGTGKIVELMRESGLEAFGCDIFYEGGDRSGQVKTEYWGGIIKKIVAQRIPFEDHCFDFVVNNQVMEHVESLDTVLSEVARVLKPGGSVLSLFPDIGIWREGHCGIPFLHWFPKGAKIRVLFALFFRLLGFGHHKGNKTPWEWSIGFCEWIDKWTYYRDRKEIKGSYHKFFEGMRHIEDQYFDLRFGELTLGAKLIPNFFKRLVVRKLGPMVFYCKKPAQLHDLRES